MWSERQGFRNVAADEIRNLFLCHLWASQRFNRIALARAALNFRFGPLSSKGEIVAKLIVDAALKRKNPVENRKKLSVQQINMLVANSEKSKNLHAGLRFAVFVLMGFYGLLRISEILELTWQDINFEEDFVVLKVRRSKTDQSGSGQTVKLDWPKETTARKKITQLKSFSRGPHDHVCGSLIDGGKVGAAAMTTLFKEACRVAGFAQGFTPHSLRGGGATFAAQQGKPTSEIMRIGRWKSVESLKSYLDPVLLPALSL